MIDKTQPFITDADLEDARDELADEAEAARVLDALTADAQARGEYNRQPGDDGRCASCGRHSGRLVVGLCRRCNTELDGAGPS